MIGLLIMALIAVGVVSAAGYAAFMLVRAGDDLQSAQANRASLEAAAAMVRASLRTVRSDGVPYAPMGTDTTQGGVTYTTLPGWLTQGAMTPWGVPFAYCPLASSSSGTGSAATVRTAGGAYAAQTVGWTAAGAARGFVVRSDAIAGLAGAPPVAALIVAPRVGGGAPPDCRAVTYDQGRFQVADGLVAAVLRDAAVSAAANDAVARMVRYAAPAPTGDGSGLDPDNRTTLADALGAWKALLPAAMTVDLAAGTHGLDPCAADSVTGAPHPGGRGRKLTLRGFASGSTAVTTAAAPAGCALSSVVLRAPADLELTGMTLAAGIVVAPAPGTQLTLADVSAGSIQAKGADVLVAGNLTAVGDTAPGLLVDGGRLRIANAAVAVASTSNAGLRARGAQVSLEGVTLSANGAPGILLEGSDTAATASAVTAQGSGMGIRQIGGRLETWGGSLTLQPSSGWGLSAETGTVTALRSTAVAFTAPSASGAIRASGAQFGLDGATVDVVNGTTYGIYLESGLLDLRGGVRVGAPTGGRPQYGVYDAGGNGISGGNAVLYGVACVGGPANATMFNGTYATGATINAGNTQTPWSALVRASWNCNG